MPIHLPKKREKREKEAAGDSKRNQFIPGAPCLAICTSTTVQVEQITVPYREGREIILGVT